MRHSVILEICDRGYIVDDAGMTYACNNNQELNNCFARIKAVVECEEEENDNESDE